MVRYEPPPGVTAGGVGTVVDERVDLRDITATVVDLAVRGYLTIREEEKESLFGLTTRRTTVFERKRESATGGSAPPRAEGARRALRVRRLGGCRRSQAEVLPAHPGHSRRPLRAHGREGVLLRQARLGAPALRGRRASRRPGHVRPRRVLGILAWRDHAERARRSRSCPACSPPSSSSRSLPRCLAARRPASNCETGRSVSRSSWAGSRRSASRPTARRTCSRPFSPTRWHWESPRHGRASSRGSTPRGADRRGTSARNSEAASPRSSFEQSLSGAMTRAGQGMTAAPRSSGSSGAGGGGSSGGGGGGGGGGSW